MRSLLPIAELIAARLIERGESIAIAEGSAGGLVSAALLAVPGASKYFLGSAVIYTAAARSALLGITADDMRGMRPATEPYAALLAGRIRDKLGATWGLAETGAAGQARPIHPAQVAKIPELRAGRLADPVGDERAPAFALVAALRPGRFVL